MDKFLGKDVNYWLELDRWSKENNYEDLIKDLAELRFKVICYESHISNMNKELNSYEKLKLR